VKQPAANQVFPQLFESHTLLLKMFAGYGRVDFATS
jgi:hypothetical protein